MKIVSTNKSAAAKFNRNGIVGEREPSHFLHRKKIAKTLLGTPRAMKIKFIVTWNDSWKLELLSGGKVGPVS